MSCSPTGSSLPSWPAPSVPNPAGCWSPIATPHPIPSLPPGHTSTWSPAESTSSGTNIYNFVYKYILLYKSLLQNDSPI